MVSESVVVIGSGPSLSWQDCETVRQSGLYTIAVNSSWKAARFCDVIYGGDPVWWDAYGHEIDIAARRVCFMRQCSVRHGIECHGGGQSVLNSGMRSVQWAIKEGAKNIILLGFDCSVENGAHWHPDHDKTGNPDKAKAQQWMAHFAMLASEATAAGVEIINASRATVLPYFKRMDLEEVICSFAEC